MRQRQQNPEFRKSRLEPWQWIMRIIASVIGLFSMMILFVAMIPDTPQDLRYIFALCGGLVMIFAIAVWADSRKDDDDER